MKTAPAQEALLHVQDRALDAINKIETLIGLMEAATQLKNSEPLEAPLVASTVCLIRGETITLKQAIQDLSSFQKQAGKRRRSGK